MFVILQYPFTDLRLLLNEYPDKEASFFPNIYINNCFKSTYYRYLGSNNDRKRKTGLPSSEQTYYNSRAFAFFCDDSKYKIVFQRLYNDGAFFHFDVGIYAKGLDGNDFIEKIFSSVKVKCKLSEDVFSLTDLQKYLSLQYQYGTYRKKFLDTQKSDPAKRLLYHGKPAVFVESKDIHLIRGNIKVGRDIYIIYRDEIINNRSVSVWLIEKGTRAKSEELRRLRICMSKVHCIREGVTNCLNYLRTIYDLTQINPHKFINQFTWVVNYMSDEVSQSHGKSEVLNFAFNSYCQIDGIAWDEFCIDLNSYMAIFRDLIKLKEVKNTMEKMGFNVNITNSNVISQSPNSSISTNQIANNDIAELVKLLNETRAILNTADIESDEKESLIDDIDIIEEEIKKDAPKETRLKKAIAGIKSFAATIGGGLAVSTTLATNLGELISKVEPIIEKIKSAVR